VISFLGDMLNIAYTTSVTLRENLSNIEILRTQIALLPLTPKTEQRLRWETTVQRLYWAASLVNNPITKHDIISILTTDRLRFTDSQHDTLGYKQALDDISHDWLASDKPVTIKTIQSFWSTLTPQLSEHGSYSRLNPALNQLKQLLDYLSNQQEHPVITSAIATSQVLLFSTVRSDFMRLSLVLGYLLLSKAGYDFRGLLTLEDYWKRNATSFEKALWSISHEGNTNTWLELYVDCVLTQLKSALESARHNSFTTQVEASFFDLNNRQKSILNLLSSPQSAMTNKRVQKKFKVSQITASRDLAKLHSLGLLYAHGKGRSTSYSRI